MAPWARCGKAASVRSRAIVAGFGRSAFTVVTADPDAATVTLRDRGHTITASERMLTTATLRGRSHTDTASDDLVGAVTIRDSGHTDTRREMR